LDGAYEELAPDLRSELDWLGRLRGCEPQRVDVEDVLSLVDSVATGPSALMTPRDPGVLSRLGEATRRLIYQKCSVVSAPRCVNHYLSLIGGLSPAATSHAAIFTTNYDRTFECCFTATGFGDTLSFQGYKPRLVNGFMTGPHGGFVWSKDAYAAAIDGGPQNEWRIPLYKLHGSVGWISKAGLAYDVGTELQRDIDRPPLLVFPGYKGLPSNSISRFARYRLLEELEKADQVLVIGFSFRDDYIADLFDHAKYRRRDRGPVRGLRIDPADTLPVDTRVTWYEVAFREIRHLKRPFGKVGQESTPNIWIDQRTGQLRYGA
jgi:hypothetical protein